MIMQQLRSKFAHQRQLRYLVMRFRARTLNQSDVYIAAYPKSGSTWLRMLLARALGAQPHMASIPDLLPPLGWHNVEGALRIPDGGRLIKVHEAASLLHGTAPSRAVVLVRDGRDVAVSYYHYRRLLGLEDASFSAFLERFLAGRVDPYGAWPEHVSGWLRWPGSTLLVRYEDLLAKGAAEVQRVANFLGLHLGTRQAQEVYNDCHVERIRQGESRQPAVTTSGKRIGPTAGFVRRATAGGWDEMFDDRSRLIFEACAGDVLRHVGYGVTHASMDAMNGVISDPPLRDRRS